MKAILLLEDGTVFEGISFGASGCNCGEVVFNTSMSGYQEILTDPSYNEQIIVMTNPLIGNYGINQLDAESAGSYARGFVVKENCQYPSNWRNEISLSCYLQANNVVGLEGIDTRKLVKLIRDRGAMKGIISSEELSVSALKKKIDNYPGLEGRDIASDITTRRPYKWDRGTVDVLSGREHPSKCKYNVAVFDFGVKQNILRMLYSADCNVSVVPADTTAEQILQMGPDGVLLSNGPGDPAPLSYAIETVRKLLGKVPIFGICLGHQILGLALGGRTYKLKFGHRGANHPVKNLETGKIEITSQNHGFCVDAASLPQKGIEITHRNLNDGTVEGIRCTLVPAFSVQYHPEASPGPHDANYLFEQFRQMMDKRI